MKVLVNLVAFQLVWLACVLGAARGVPWLGPLALIPFAFWTLSLRATRGADLRVLILAAMGGFLVDSGFAASGMIRYEQALLGPYLAPPWIVAMWINLGLTLNHSLAWLRRHVLLGVGFGGVGGPLAYLAGRHLGAIDFGVPTVQAVLVLAVAWAAVTPVLAHAAGRRRPHGEVLAHGR